MRIRFLLLLIVAVASPVWADPCGLVPPISTQDNPEKYLTRTGEQLTYVFYKNGIEDVALRPAFEGKVSDFGMLIPFPSAPAIRKVPDDIFFHVKNAVEPPQVTINLNPPMPQTAGARSAPNKSAKKKDGGLKYDDVNVVSEEAMGMYQVAVLEAGSSDALKKWMEKNGYIYPRGMGKVVGEYVEKSWCFVAVKARVGKKKGVTPKAGMKDTDPNLPEDAKFTGAVQAMGFRFKTDEPVVPMRLSAHNPGDLHNIVFALTDKGVRFKQLPKKFVKKQISGEDLYKNLTEPLPAKIIYWDKDWKKQKTQTVKRGEQPDLPKHLQGNWAEGQLKAGRDPVPHNGKAKEVFASDLLAAQHGRLIHEYEIKQKELLNIGEELGLRGPHVDDLMDKETQKIRDRALAKATEAIKNMTLTVIEGDFPREVIRDEDLTFLAYNKPDMKKKGMLPEPLIILLILLVLVSFVARRRTACDRG